MREHKKYKFNVNAVNILLKGFEPKQRLANQLGVSVTAVYNWCAGRSAPSEKNISKLAEYFGCDVSVFKIGR